MNINSGTINLYNSTATFNQKYSFDFSSYWNNLVKVSAAESNGGNFVLNNYICEDLDDIKNFLSNNSSVQNYLILAPSIISKYFDEFKLGLEIITDPEIEQDDSILFLKIIISDDNVKDAWLRLNSLTKEWLIPVVGKDIGKFNIDIEFS